LTVFSESEGLITILAKGIRKSKKQEYTLLNLLNEYELVFTEPAQGNLPILSELTLLKDFPTDLPLQTWIYAQAAVELITKVLLPAEEITLVYQLLSRYLDYLQRVQTNAVCIFWRFVLHLLNLMGIPINLYRCSACGKPQDGFSAYSPLTGQLLCDECQQKAPTSFSLNQESSHILSLLPQIGNYLEDLVLSDEMVRQLHHFFLYYLSVQFNRDIHLKSLGL